MCNFHTWFHDDKSGYVIECRQCNKIQVCFGNLLLCLQDRTFESFRQAVERNVAAVLPAKDRHIKSIVLTTACNAVNIILSEAELDGLSHMIEYADTEMKTAALLNMFNEN
ncbi:MAG: hypothetical protein QM737_05585 [Ferruginibacter sp.]